MIFDKTPNSVRLRILKRKVTRVGVVFVAALAPATFGILTIILGLIGWSWQLFDGTFHSLVAVIIRSLGDFALSPKNFEDGNGLTEVSSVCGILTLYSSFAVIIASVFREQRRKLLARYVLKKHHLVIGDTILAKRVGAIWGRTDRRTLRVAPPNAPTPDFLQRVVRHAYNEGLAGDFAMRRARRILFDLGDDASTIALVLKALSVLALAAPRRRPSSASRDWICVVQDERFADYFLSEIHSIRSKRDQGVELPQIVLLQPDQLMARELLSASGLSQVHDGMRVHALIVGHGLLGKHLLQGLLLTPPSEQSAALVTVLTHQAERHAKSFANRMLSPNSHLDISFLDPEALEELLRLGDPDVSSLRNRDATVPVTVVFLTSDQLHDNILSYIFIQAIRRKLGRFTCKVFSRRGDGEDSDTLLPTSSVVSETAGFATFGLSDECLGAYLDTPERMSFDAFSEKRIDLAGAERS